MKVEGRPANFRRWWAWGNAAAARDLAEVTVEPAEANHGRWRRSCIKFRSFFCGSPVAGIEMARARIYRFAVCVVKRVLRSCPAR